MNITKTEVQSELEYINKVYEFSRGSSKELQSFILENSLADYYDGVLNLTNAGELAIGYTEEEIGMMDDDEESDITESFFYKDEYDEQF